MYIRLLPSDSMDRRTFLDVIICSIGYLFVPSIALSSDIKKLKDYHIDFKMKPDISSPDLLQRLCSSNNMALGNITQLLFLPVQEIFGKHFHYNLKVNSSLDNVLNSDTLDLTIHYCQADDVFEEVYRNMEDVADFYERNKTMDKDKIDEMRIMYNKSIEKYNGMSCTERLELYSKLFMKRTNDCSIERFTEDWQAVWLNGFRQNVRNSGGLTDASRNKIYIFGDISLQKYFINQTIKNEDTDVQAFSNGIEKYLKYCSYIICHELGHIKKLQHSNNRFLENSNLNVMYGDIVSGGNMDSIIGKIADGKYGYPGDYNE